MKRLLSSVVVCIFCMLPVSAKALSHADAKHLALRTAFAPSPALINALLPLNREQAIEYLLAQPLDNHVMPPDFLTHPAVLEPQKNMTTAQKQAANKLRRQQTQALRGWYVERMIKSRSPLREMMTLFWQNHFTTSDQKINDPVMMFNQYQIMRQQSLGYFDQMLSAVMRDPAILFYLDNQKNKKGKPNENLARELLELYTLGEGNYTENDVKNVARALTGWGLNKLKRQFVNTVKQHDQGVKTILGHTGNFAMPDVLGILLSTPHTAELITYKLWLNFISPNPDPVKVKNLAKRFKDSVYNISFLVKSLLMDDAFWAQENRGVLVKSPIELLVGLYRSFDVTDAPYKMLANQSSTMGMTLFAPPNVKGWPISSTEWINTSSLLRRQTILERAIRGKEMKNGPMSKNRQLFEKSRHWARAATWTNDAELLLAVSPVTDIEGKWPMQRLKQLFLDPVYQLK